MWKTLVETDRLQKTVQYSACALHGGYLRLQTHSEYVVPIASRRLTIVTRTPLNATLYVHCLSCFGQVFKMQFGLITFLARLKTTIQLVRTVLNSGTYKPLHTDSIKRNKHF